MMPHFTSHLFVINVMVPTFYIVPDAALEELCIPPGDVIRLTDRAVVWWQSSDAKRKRSAFEPDGEAQGEPPAKHTVAYERRGVDAVSLAHRW
jgi:hypothetical protein